MKNDTKDLLKRVWHHAGSHGDDEYRKPLTKKDILPIAIVLMGVLIFFSVLVYFAL